MSLPQLSSILSRVTGDLSVNSIAPSVQQAYGNARQGIMADYDTAGRGQQAYLTQSFAQGQNLYGTNQIADAKTMAAQALDADRQKALKLLDFQEAEAGLGQFNTLMGLLGQGAGTALGLGGGFAGAQTGAISMLPNQSPGYSALGGAMAGAGAGATFGPYGAAIGGVLGGLGGYLGAGQ